MDSSEVARLNVGGLGPSPILTAGCSCEEQRCVKNVDATQPLQPASKSQDPGVVLLGSVGLKAGVWSGCGGIRLASALEGRQWLLGCRHLEARERRWTSQEGGGQLTACYWTWRVGPVLAELDVYCK